MKEQNIRNFSPWKVGDKVWLEATNLRLSYPSRKLAPKQQGPFEISQVLSPLTYHLRLPSTWKIHDVFHASLLSSYKETEAHGLNFSKPPPDLIGTEEEYKVEQIISHRGTAGRCRYLTTWKGYSSLENTWEPKSNRRHAPEILRTYKWTHQLNYLTLPCPSPQNMTTPSPSAGVTSPGNWASLNTNSIISNATTLTSTMRRPTLASVRNPAAPSTTRTAGRGVSS